MAVYARYSELGLLINVGSTSAEVVCSTMNSLSTRVDRHPSGLTPAFEVMKQWVDDCHTTHSCSNFRRSTNNPSYLLQILSGNRARVVKGPEHSVKYIVLSYSWGNPESPTMSREDWKVIKGAATKRLENGHIVPERSNPFSRSELPKTMQDAIYLAEKFNITYIWIDSVCIPKGSNWDAEAVRMHEVYGNAHFTLCASSSRKATDRMIVDRDAWIYPMRGCRIDNQWLSTTSNHLNDVRMNSPTADRGWILQEERLSPRILYWTGQEAYWSCSESQLIEPCQTTRSDTRNIQQWSPAYKFLQLCRQGDIHGLQNEWVDLVESYTRKDLAQGKDRFLALAGLATCYFEAISNPGFVFPEEYLAGLWRTDLGRQLTWSVSAAVPYDKNLLSIAPSWSWASLPLRTKTRMRHPFTMATRFKVMQDIQPYDDRTLNVVVTRGAYIKSVEVSGRLRPFLTPAAKHVTWQSIIRMYAGEEKFTFAAAPEQSVYARNQQSGQILFYEAWKEEIVGQLDYVPSLCGSQAPPHHLYAFVDEGAETELFCLEVGTNAMLLLRKIQPETVGLNRYIRVGVSIGYRSSFFNGCQEQHVLLC
ncbi:HET-domain-containing protein [Pseudovirgaria hyperparasitica]|uniref:HET-domain-containing protein n=1 Tax=Pseudovirgaria hyperparasitica TaxID=470096 RepID=A0A6A6W493_9PEZI|nr:HET-domain-containing protein [Pseudovirgaria hyperparasitica]KAF2756989.1 HET-domain-containing protein [Pseudovirgaria hyperparasitica]